MESVHLPATVMCLQRCCSLSKTNLSPRVLSEGRNQNCGPIFKCVGRTGIQKKYSNCRVLSAEMIVLIGPEGKSSKPSLCYSDASFPQCIERNVEILLCRGKKNNDFCLFQKNCPRTASIHSQQQRAQPLGDLVISAEYVSLMQLNYDCKFIKQGKITGIYIKPHQ